MCRHAGYPLEPVPGANVFLVDHDMTTADGSIECYEVSTREMLLLAGRGVKVMKRLWDAAAGAVT